MKDIDIKYKLIRVPETITVDGTTYPRNQHNLTVVSEYEETQDENVLDNLVNFSIAF